jgi:hypothetical protein
MAGSEKAARVHKLFKPSVPGFPAAADPLEHPAAKPRRSSKSRQSSSMLVSCYPPSASSTSTRWLTSSKRHTLALLPGFAPPALIPASHR